MDPEFAKTHSIPETKLGQKTQHNYNRLNYKMSYKSEIIHKKRIFSLFSKESNELKQNNNKNNNNNNNNNKNELFSII